ncbi:MAG: protein kinase [Gemmatimonadota bacterium]|nr:protein kinase [Gemmatimonadota bacterium]
MKYNNRWRKIKEIGEGGQGKVYLALDLSKSDFDVFHFPLAIQNALEIKKRLIQEEDESKENALENLLAGNIVRELREGIQILLSANDCLNQKALKILHSPDKSRNYDDAEERLRRELEAMKQVDHPNLLKIEDSDLDEKWFVSEYYPAGTLEKNSDRFTGQVKRTLTAIQPVVEGVSSLHRAGLVHRDIKPENIFLDGEKLVLGDFGLVFFADRNRTRLSHTMENVGSHRWMPPWAENARLEEVNPSFDVFSLGKVIWSMISKELSLPLWYQRKQKYNLQFMFPDIPAMEFVNELLDKCVVENEADCLPDASNLWLYIDDILRALELSADPIRDILRPCKVCGFGFYRPFSDFPSKDMDRSEIELFGLKPEGDATFKIHNCNRCGHVQLFYTRDGTLPFEWSKLKR